MKIRVQVLLEQSTIDILEKEAKDNQITLSAVIRQKVEAMVKFKKEVSDLLKNEIKE